MKSHDWICIYKTTLVSQAYMIRNVLEEYEINVVVVNKKDSSYNNFGNYEIFAAPLEAEAARNIINEHYQME